jgi:hypothetical protein
MNDVSHPFPLRGIITYTSQQQETAMSLASGTASPGARLFANYCSFAPEANIHAHGSPWKSRFKVTMRCNNIEEFGLPSFITSYNAKPVLIRNTGNLIRSVC